MSRALEPTPVTAALAGSRHRRWNGESLRIRGTGKGVGAGRIGKRDEEHVIVGKGSSIGRNITMSSKVSWCDVF